MNCEQPENSSHSATACVVFFWRGNKIRLESQKSEHRNRITDTIYSRKLKVETTGHAVLVSRSPRNLPYGFALRIEIVYWAKKIVSDTISLVVSAKAVNSLL